MAYLRYLFAILPALTMFLRVAVTAITEALPFDGVTGLHADDEFELSYDDVGDMVTDASRGLLYALGIRAVQQRQHLTAHVSRGRLHMPSRDNAPAVWVCLAHFAKNM